MTEREFVLLQLLRPALLLIVLSTFVIEAILESGRTETWASVPETTYAI